MSSTEARGPQYGDNAWAALDGRGGRPMTALAGSGPLPSGSTPNSDGTPWKPEIAIVTITKDDPVGIKRTIASVERQDFTQYEHVVADGGSGTDVADWLASWRDGDPERHILVDNPPDGIYPAMNLGIQRTSAPVIVVLNGGDKLRPGTLSLVSDHHRLHGWRWAYGGIESRAQDGGAMGEYTFTPFSMWTFRAGLEIIPHPSAYVTRDLYSEVGLYRDDLGTGADQEFFLRASVVAEPGQIPGILAVFELGGVSSQTGPIAREIDWHRMRLASETAFGQSSATDLVATALLLLRQFLFWMVRQMRRMGRRGKR